MSGAVELSCSFSPEVKSRRWPRSWVDPRSRRSTRSRQALLDLLRTEALLLPDEHAPGVCRDPDDDYLLGCAAAGGFDYLVTGDADLLAVGRYRGVTIVDARQFLGVLSA